MNGFGGHENDTAAKRELLLNAAERAFCSLGYARSSMGAIADEAGVTRPTVYAYFASKDEVLKALSSRVRDELLAIQEDASGLPHAELIKRTLDSYLKALIAHHGMLAVLAHEAISNLEIRNLRNDIFQRSDRRNERYLRRLEAHGAIEPMAPPQVVAEAITGIAIRFAEIGFAEPQRQPQLSADLCEIYLGMVRLKTDTPPVRSPH